MILAVCVVGAFMLGAACYLVATHETARWHCFLCGWQTPKGPVDTVMGLAEAHQEMHDCGLLDRDWQRRARMTVAGVDWDETA